MVAARHNRTESAEKGRPKWWRAFLAALARVGTVSAGCRAAKVTRSNAYLVRESCDETRAEWDAALEQFADYLEEEATRRATQGSRRSDVLLIVQLKAARPNKYRDNLKVDSSSSVRVEIVETLTGATDDEGHSANGRAAPGAAGVPA